ncbi:MAG TPA: hypothetical protein PKC65_07360 [Pyrinomonadaceae bacterium]|nr:hypothetical protein [Pyrinomonadaceae bacterium]
MKNLGFRFYGGWLGLIALAMLFSGLGYWLAGSDKVETVMAQTSNSNAAALPTPDEKRRFTQDELMPAYCHLDSIRTRIIREMYENRPDLALVGAYKMVSCGGDRPPASVGTAHSFRSRKIANDSLIVHVNVYPDVEAAKMGYILGNDLMQMGGMFPMPNVGDEGVIFKFGSSSAKMTWVVARYRIGKVEVHISFENGRMPTARNEAELIKIVRVLEPAIDTSKDLSED